MTITGPGVVDIARSQVLSSRQAYSVDHTGTLIGLKPIVFGGADVPVGQISRSMAMPVNSGQGPSLHLSFVGRVDLYGPA
jgi:hypothetical protein